jgi:SAM-dependent methyltransferase
MRVESLILHINRENITMTGSNSPYSGISELADAEQGLVNYYSNIINLIAPKPVSARFSLEEFSILEFGAGTGFLSELLQIHFKVKVDCLEIDETLLQILDKKGFKTFSSLSEVDKKYDLIFSSNVLEHIRDDEDTLVQLSKLLKPNGILVNYVPAFPILFSQLDVSVGHFRRYTQKELKLKLGAAGYRVNRIHYVDSLGFPASFALRLLGFKSIGNIGGLRSMKIYDRYVFPISQVLDRIGFKYLFGKNIIVHAEMEA